jgi:ribosomal protein L12E/L44/L45/RPP1/RPP2
VSQAVPFARGPLTSFSATEQSSRPSSDRSAVLATSTTARRKSYVSGADSDDDEDQDEEDDEEDDEESGISCSW